MNLKPFKNIISLKTEKTHYVISIFNTIKIKFKSLKLENQILSDKNKFLSEKIKQLKSKNKQYLNIFKSYPQLYEIHIKNPELEKKDSLREPIVKSQIEALMSTKPFPIFKTIEIETINKCNGECSFCPVNKHDDPREFKMMNEDLFKNIIAQLKQINYTGRVQLFSNNEPLMDKRIFEFSKYAKEQLPNCHFSIFTNGILLNLENFLKLIPYYNTFCIDIYYDNEEEIPQNIRPIISHCFENPTLQNTVYVQFINKCAIRNNRGSNSKNRTNIYRLKTPCLLPFTQVIVRPDAKLSLCSNDTLGQYTLGDLSKDKLIDIWNSDYYNEIRTKLQKSRGELDICTNCDNFGGFGTNQDANYVFTPEQFKKQWQYLKSEYQSVCK